MPINGPDPAWTTIPNHDFQLNTVAISDDGATVLTGTSLEYGSSGDFGVYCYTLDERGVGRLLWSDPLGRTAKDGVFWVALSGDGRWAAVGGSYGSDEGGFVRFYSVADGPRTKQEFPTTSRVNEVELDADGSLAVACYADRIDCFARSGSEWRVGGTQQLEGTYARSCGVNPDGGLIVVGGQVESGTAGPSESASKPGFVAVMAWTGNSLDSFGRLETEQEVLRAVISGSFVAASTHGGTVSLWYGVMGPAYQRAWTVAPEPGLSLIYGLAIAQTGTTVWIGGAGNGTAASGAPGWVFALRSDPNPGGTGFTPTQLWHAATDYAPNPASYFDAGARLLTAADGEPRVNEPETPGNFYLFDVATGTPVWKHPTPLMNWGMRINAAGSACVGGSDDGTLYYWGGPSE